MVEIKKENGYYYIVGMLNRKRYHKSLHTKKRSIANSRYLEFLNTLDDDVKKKIQIPGKKLSDLHREFSRGRTKRGVQALNTVFNRWIKYQGNIALSDMTEAKARNFLLQYVHLANSTRSQYTDAVKSSFEFARKHGYIDNNPLIDIERVKVSDNARVEFFSKEEIQIIRNAEGFDRDIVYFLLLSGIRSGALAALTWKNINWKNKTLIMDKPLKGGRKRQIPLSDDAMDILQRNYNEFGQGKLSEYCFLSKTGKPFDRHIDRTVRAFFDRVKVDGIAHKCRHTYASYQVMAGTPLRVLQDLLGHRNIKETMVYAHLSPESINLAKRDPYSV